MPLSEEQKRQILIERGYDPSQFVVEESPATIPEPETPAITPPLSRSNPNLSAPQSAWEGFKQSLVPSAAALGTSALALKGLSQVAPSPFIKIPGSIAAGILGSYAANKLQEKALESAMSPEAYQERLTKQQSARTQHPYANLLGELIPSFLGFGPYGLDKVYRGITKLPKQAVGAKALLEAEKAALSGAALNTGLAGGGEAVREKVSGEPIDPTKVAIASIVGGALQNQPWGLGRKMFPSMNPSETVTPIKPKEADSTNIDPETLPTKEELAAQSKAPPATSYIKPDKALVKELQGKEIRPSLSTDVSDPAIKAGEPANRPNIEEDYNADPTEKFYQEDKKPSATNDKWTKEQLIPNTNFAYKIQRWANTPEGSQVRPASQMVGTLKNKFNQEWELFKDLGLEKHLTEEIPSHKITGSYVDEWIRKNGPKVEVKNLAAKPELSVERKEMADLQHRLETQGLQRYFDNGRDIWYYKNRKEISYQDMPDPIATMMQRYDELLKKNKSIIDKNESATARYSIVNPKPLDQMEGAVDLLVRIPVQTEQSPVKGIYPNDIKPKQGQVKYSSSHYPTEGKNLLAHVRGYMETLPESGKKVFRIFEVQSDWAQHIRDQDPDLIQKAQELGITPEELAKRRGRLSLPDPLLKHYERLALKSAIDHAKKQGADYIALDDAETAMITEGHDKVASMRRWEKEMSSEEADKLVADLANKEAIYLNKTNLGEGRAIVRSEGTENFLEQNPRQSKRLQELGFTFAPRGISQEQGMRLHYDRTLPKILEELTGQKGERVEFGEHQNAVNKNSPSLDNQVLANQIGEPRKDLIFKNPDGTPKTRSTSRLYSLDKAKQIIDEKGGISLTGNKLYQKGNTPEQQKPLTPEKYETESKPLAAKRGVEISRVPEIISERTGNPVRGEALPDARKALITDIATSDTPAHEISHVLLEDLGKSKLQADRDFYNRGIRLAGSKESLVENAGLRYEEINNAPLRAWFQDLGSNIKRLTRIAEQSKDYERILARRLRDDRPYSESPEYVKSSETDAGVSTPPKQALYSEDEAKGTKNAPTAKDTEGPGLVKRLSQKLDPVIDKLRQSGPIGAKAADAAEKAFRDMTRYEGEITNALVGETKNLSKGSNDAVAAYIYKKRGYNIPEDTSVGILNPKDQEIIDSKVHPILKRVVALQKELPYERTIKEDPNYRGPIMVDPKVVEQLNKLPESSLVKKKLVNDFVEHQVKYNKDIKGDRAKAIGIFNDYIRGIGSTHGTPEFKALRKAEGYGLPFSWMDKDINRLFRRYGDRVAKDLAYFKHIESNPEVASIFGAGKNLEGQPALFNENLATIKRLLQGDFTRKDAITDTAESFTRALILGPLTGIKNIVGSINKSLIYTPIKDLPKIGKAFFYLDKGLKDSLQMGVNRHNTLDIFTRNDEGISTIADNFRKVATIIRNVTGANWIEQVSRARTQAQGDLTARAVIGRYAKSGGVEEAKWLNKFKDKEMSLDQFRTGDVSEETIKRIAANFVERVEGTYDARGLPAGLLEPTSIFYYLGSLSKWSVETGNVIKKDVLMPLVKEGDWAPFLRYTLGSLAVAGPLISEINELFSGGKKSQYPNFKELEAKGNWDDYAHKIAELASLAGFAGIYGDLVKSSLDMSKGMKPRGYNVPSVELGTDILHELNLAQAAVGNGQNPIEVGISLVANIITDSFQAARLVHNQFKPEDIERANKFRDKRVYDRMEDKKIPTMTGDRPDRYGSEDINRFKESKSFKESIEILNKEILPRIKGDKNRKDILEGLKRNSYQTMPSDPIERKKYYDYLVATQGEEEAKKRLKDKLLQDFLNTSKGKIVPKY